MVQPGGPAPIKGRVALEVADEVEVGVETADFEDAMDTGLPLDEKQPRADCGRSLLRLDQQTKALGIDEGQAPIPYGEHRLEDGPRAALTSDGIVLGESELESEPPAGLGPPVGTERAAT